MTFYERLCNVQKGLRSPVVDLFNIICRVCSTKGFLFCFSVLLLQMVVKHIYLTAFCLLLALCVCVRCVINFIQKKRKGKWESEREIIVVLPSHFICVNVKVVVSLLWVAGFDLLALVEVSVLLKHYTKIIYYKYL